MKHILLIFSFCCCIVFSAAAQSDRLPLKMQNGHLQSEWSVNGIRAQVFLETGFPKVVFNESFIKKYAEPWGIELIKAPENTRIALWGGQQHSVSFLIRDTLSINGIDTYIDALVVDYSGLPSWDGRDLVFPIRDLNEKIELNIREGYMSVLNKEDPLPGDFISYACNSDSLTKGLYLETSLTVCDGKNEQETLTGSFLLDLGAGNAFIVNKNRSEAADFVRRSERMLLDSASFKPNPQAELQVIMPAKTRFGNMEISDTFIPAMKIYASKASGRYAGIVGNQFFQHFIVIFDFTNNLCYLKPNSDKVKITEKK